MHCMHPDLQPDLIHTEVGQRHRAEKSEIQGLRFTEHSREAGHVGSRTFDPMEKWSPQQGATGFPVLQSWIFVDS